MNRRNYIRLCGAAAAGGVGALAGCLGDDGNNSPPPRRSSLIESISASDGVLQIEPDPEKWVDTRRSIDVQQNSVAGALGSLLPVDRAQAQKGGAGATGRGAGGFSGAPRTHHGRAWFAANNDDDDWYDNHSDKVTRVPAVLAAVGVSYLGINSQFREQAPGPGPLNWEREFSDTDGMITIPMLSERGQGWYRIGADVRTDDSAVRPGESANLGWECIDIRVQNTGTQYSITERWKVSPEI